MPVGVAARRRRRRLIAAVAVTSVVAVGTAALVAAADVRAPAPTGAAGVYAPPDGSAGWVRIDPGTLRQRENGRSVGPSVLFEFPQQALFSAWNDYPTDTIQSAVNWSVSWSGAGIDPAAAPRDLYSLSGGDIGLVMTTGTATGLVYTPALRVLASDAASGSTWTSEGTAHSAVPGGDGTQTVTFDYTSAFSARAPQDPAVRDFAAGRDGCLEVGAHLVYRPSGIARATPITIDDISLWCPGQGIVASATANNGGSPVRVVPVDAPGISSTTVAGATTPGSQWVAPERWTAQAVTATATDPTFGPTPRRPSPALPPVAIGHTIVVADINSGNLSFLTAGATAMSPGAPSAAPSAAPSTAARSTAAPSTAAPLSASVGSSTGLVETRIARPGGDVTALAAVGDQVLAATSQRRLVAYGPDGTRHWDIPLADVVFVPPVGDGGTGILIASTDGSLTAVDAATGAAQWTAPLSGDGLTHLAYDGGRAIVADRTGRVSALSVADGTTDWTFSGPVVTALAAAGGAVYTAAKDTSVARFDGTDGTLVWGSSAGTGVDALALVDGRIVALSWADLLAFDATTGAPAWRAAGADRMVSDGGSVIVEGRGPARLIDASGAALQEWTIGAKGEGAARYLLALTDQVWMFDTVSASTRIGP